MHLLRFGFASVLLSGICFAATTAQGQSLLTPQKPVAVPTPEYPVPVFSSSQPLQSPQALEADRLLGQLQEYRTSSQDILKLGQQALRFYQQTGDFEGQFFVLIQISAAHYRLYQDQRAVTIAQQAVLAARNSKSLPQEQKAFQFLSQLYEALGNSQDAIAAQKQVVEVARKQGARSERLALQDLGAQHTRFRQYAAAIVAYRQSLDVPAQPEELTRYNRYSYSYSYNDTVGELEINALRRLINAYTTLGEPEKAKPFGVRLVKRVQSLALIKNFRFASDLNPADLPLLQAAAKLNHELGDATSEALILLHLGRSYADLKQTALALETAQQVLQLSHQQSSRALEIGGLELAGDAQLQLQQFPQAIETYQQLRTIAQEQKDTFTQFQALTQLAKAYDAIGQTEKSQRVRREIATLPAAYPLPTLASKAVPQRYFALPDLNRRP
jgi:tetratricopeptide (TPR) repeat protein